MAHIANFAAEQYGEMVNAVGASGKFIVGVSALGGKKLLSTLSNGDTIMYRAESDGGKKWEIGLGTYASSTKEITRTTVLYSSNSNNAVNFLRDDGAGANVKLEGLNKIASTAAAYTVTNWTADRTLAGDESTAANIAASLATLIKDLIDAGVLKGTVTAP